MRDWTRLPEPFASMRTFMDDDRTQCFLIRILKRYVTTTFLRKTEKPDDLVRLVKAVRQLLPKDSALLDVIHRIVERIAEIPLSDQNEKFLRLVITDVELPLGLSTLEKVYLSQKVKFVEIPLTDSFVSFSHNLNKADKSEMTTLPFEQMVPLFEMIAKSPTIFQLASSILKEIIVVTKFSPIAVKFVEAFLSNARNHCEKNLRDIVDLYPKQLQFCVILLKIEPELHTKNSRDYVVESLKNIFLESHIDIMILMCHFPAWLKVFGDFINCMEEESERTNGDSK